MPATWEPPFVQPHLLDPTNKFGRRMASNSTRSGVEGHAVEALTRRYGSPLFIVSERRLQRVQASPHLALTGLHNHLDTFRDAGRPVAAVVTRHFHGRRCPPKTCKTLPISRSDR